MLPTNLPAVIDVSGPGRPARTFAQALVSLAGAAGVALVVPLAVIAVSTPVALALRGLLEAAEWLLAMVR